MNTRARHLRVIHVPIALVGALLAILGCLAPLASAQSAPGAALATQFVGGITGEGIGYRLSPDAVFHTPEGDFVGRAGLATFGEDLADAFAFLEFSMQSAVQAGDMVIVSLTITGVNTGSYHGIAANCAGITLPAVAVIRVNDQPDVTGAPVETVVVEQWIDYDRALLTSQISAVNLMDPGDRPGCAEPILPLNQDADPGDLPPVSPVPPARGLPY